MAVPGEWPDSRSGNRSSIQRLLRTTKLPWLGPGASPRPAFRADTCTWVYAASHVRSSRRRRCRRCRRHFDAPAVRAWCGLALEALGRAREEIDAINVFPVADGDTGTNLYLTVESAAAAVEAVFAAHDDADSASCGAPRLGARSRRLALPTRYGRWRTAR